MGARSFATVQSQQMIDKILSVLRDGGHIDTGALAKAVGASQGHTCYYLRYMVDLNLVHRVGRSIAVQCGRIPAVWAIGRADGKPEDTDDMQQRITMCRVWDGKPPPMFEPMAYLFGRAA